MKTTKSTTSKWANYSSLSAGLIALPAIMQSQVQYTDIEPDELLFQDENQYEGWKYADLDGDLVFDVGLHFSITYDCMYCPSNTFFHLELIGNFEIATAMAEPCTVLDSSSSDTCYWPSIAVAAVFLDGETLSPTNQFGIIDNIYQTHQCGFPYGNMCIQGFFQASYGTSDEQFLGFRKTGIDTNLCWLRLYWEDEALFMTQAACELQPNTPITIHAIPEEVIVNEPFLNQQISILIEGDQLVINIAGNSESDFHLYDNTGRLIMSESILSGTTYLPFTFKTGIYIAEVMNNNSRITKKLLLH